FNLRQVETNLPSGEILDILVFENQLFVSQATKDEKGCHTNNISIYSAIVSLRYLDFSEFYANPLNNDKNKVDKYCDNKMSPVGGALEIDTINNTILITGTIFDNKFEKFKSNEIDGNFLKTNKFASIFSIDLITKEKKIISIGHRNPLGLIKNKEGYILSTEHGPRGGDEINKIIENKNYGWPIVSAGEPYVTKGNDIYFYKKNHEKNGFEEPIYSFVPSIGISRIIEINDNFSSKWQNNYFITSLRNKSLYRVEFDNKFTKVKTIEKINVGKRIRDISYSSTKKLFFLALESKQANLGILYKK
ncbi:PQQ-dependent sugar dehydrogenase, partial [Candidatus Pelagibacter sp.]|nr:PQQ-dependent sugar dehydrogenase [Candidatus Pelagibacter sp.]